MTQGQVGLVSEGREKIKQIPKAGEQRLETLEG